MSLYKDIIGHERQKKILSGSYRRGRIASAYLFSGEEGVGKRSLAVEFARLLNCLSPEDRDGVADSCGRCENCKRMAINLHPDIKYIEPDDGVIKIEQIREAIEFLSFKPLEAERKVIIIDGAEQMNAPASNAFLKTLEEPPGSSVIILVSHQPERLLDTVRSRCFHIRFNPLPVADTIEVLKRNGITGQRHIEHLARLSQGAPGKVLTDEMAEITGEEVFSDLAKGVVQVAWKDRTEMEDWLRGFVLFIRDIAVIGTGLRDEKLLFNKKLLKTDTESGITTLPLKTCLKLYEEAVRVLNAVRFNINHTIAGNYFSYLLKECYGDLVRK
ncbi:MAG: DNA polymerase III subunit delta' [Nitrospirae bacterium]|nr:MAG: DNA polymerase III subunit delta' [Nitrospirota bacterium]